MSDILEKMKSYLGADGLYNAVSEIQSLQQQLSTSQKRVELAVEALEVIEGIKYTHIGCAVHNRLAREALSQLKE